LKISTQNLALNRIGAELMISSRKSGLLVIKVPLVANGTHTGTPFSKNFGFLGRNHGRQESVIESRGKSFWHKQKISPQAQIIGRSVLQTSWKALDS